MSDLEYFDLDEFACSCCGSNHINQESAIKLNKARSIAGIPFKVNSAYRCPAHNESIGSKSSVHPSGYAFDISATSSRQRYRILNAMLSVGFTRIGISKSFIHCDDDPSKSPEVMWVYK